MKTCSRCGETKPLGLFYRSSDKKDGRQSHCKSCDQKARLEPTRHGKSKAYHRARYIANRSDFLRQARAWAKAHPQKIAAHHRSQVAAITPGYARQLLTGKSLLSAADIPDELVELKRAQLKLHRQLTKPKTQNEECN